MVELQCPEISIIENRCLMYFLCYLIAWLIWISWSVAWIILGQLLGVDIRLCGVWLIYVGTVWFWDWLKTYFDKTMILDLLTIGSFSNFIVGSKSTSSGFNRCDFQNNIWSLRYDLCTEAVKYVGAGIHPKLARASLSWASSPRQAKFHLGESCKLQIHLAT